MTGTTHHHQGVRPDARSTPGPTGDAGTAQSRLVLVDDHAILRQGLRSVLDREPDLHVVGEASSRTEAHAAALELRPDVMVIDLKLSAGSELEGLGLCRELHREHPEIGLLVLTTFLDERLVVEAVQAGARGYVVKDVDTTDLVSAIRSISRGESAFDSRTAAAVVKTLAGGTNDNALTARELEVLKLLAKGHSNIRIGEQLYVSPTTVKFHVSNVLRKLGVSRRTEAAYEASKRGII